MTATGLSSLHIEPIGPCDLPVARALLQLRLHADWPGVHTWLAYDGPGLDANSLCGAAVLHHGEDPARETARAWVATAPWRCGGGIGATLLDHIVAQARSVGAQAVQSWKAVDENEGAAHHLLISRGFAVCRTIRQYEATARDSVAYTARRCDWLRRRGTIRPDVRHVVGYDCPMEAVAALMLETFGPDVYSLITHLAHDGFADNWVLHALMQGDLLVAAALVHIKDDTSRLDYLAVEPAYRAGNQRRLSWAHLLLKNHMGQYELRHDRPITRFSADDHMSDTGKYARHVGGRQIKCELEYRLPLGPETARG